MFEWLSKERFVVTFPIICPKILQCKGYTSFTLERLCVGFQRTSQRLRTPWTPQGTRTECSTLSINRCRRPDQTSCAKLIVEVCIFQLNKTLAIFLPIKISYFQHCLILTVIRNHHLISSKLISILSGKTYNKISATLMLTAYLVYLEHTQNCYDVLLVISWQYNKD